MIGDSNDILNRLKAVLPTWFGSPTPVLDALLSGPAATFAEVYAQIQYVIQQTRISTATEGWLDLIAQDFFARGFNRRVAEQDGQYRARILKEILRPRVTRVAIANALTDLTGIAPIIFEPVRDAGSVSTAAPTLYLGGAALPMTGITTDSPIITTDSVITADAPGMPFAGIGAIGSLNYPDQYFITVSRPPGAGIPNIVGLVSAANPMGMPGGLGGVGSTPTADSTTITADSTIVMADSQARVFSGLLALGSLTQINGPVTDAEIYATIARNTAAGVTAWTQITAYSGATPSNFEWFPDIPDFGPGEPFVDIAELPSIFGLFLPIAAVADSNPPFGLPSPSLPGILASWQPPAPTPIRAGSINPAFEAIAVSNPPFGKRILILPGILASWQPPAPTPISSLISAPHLPQDQPVSNPPFGKRILILPSILANWQPPPPVPMGVHFSAPHLPQDQSVSNPPFGLRSAYVNVVISAWQPQPTQQPTHVGMSNSVPGAGVLLAIHVL